METASRVLQGLLETGASAVCSVVSLDIWLIHKVVWFQVLSKAVQLHTHILSQIFSLMVYYKTLSRVPCAM